MWAKLKRLVWNGDAVREVNATYRARMAEINAKDAEFKAALATAKKNNREAFKAEMAANNRKLKAAWKEG